VYQDEVYKAKYVTYLEDVVAGAFEPNAMQALYSTYESQIASFATSEMPGHSF
jgi:spore coat protein H